ncbi:C-type lectin domain family 4 member E-like isoform X2 [Micropterus salmoides]|uniref:C-type lectin domain family 4 member E-like isoform X2 n=1 Tax=Micropterus salmoides TaxID=27706 RepID=UPI0018EB0316|nr:C-type lectin domain family 4 member E-like isoform X2 [Micropterus salmoides]
MEEIYVNAEYDRSVDSKPDRYQTDSRSSVRRFHSAVLCLGLLSVFLLAGVICFGVLYHHSAADFSTINTNLTEHLQASNNKLSSMSEERELLNASLIETTKELNRLQSLMRQNKSCPAGWRIFLCSCYLLSSKTASWTEGRQDCRNRGADLVVIDSAEEQKFLSDLTTVQTSWIGLTDREMERSWKWIDGTPLTLSYWMAAQPDNGNGDPEWGEEDCAQLKPGENWKNNWNDLSCSTSLRWICEKEA